MKLHLHPPPPTADPLGPAHDAADNMTSRPKLVSGTSTAGWTFKYGAWNRLVLVEVTPTGGSASTRAAYGYYGTHWRAWRVADNNADTTIDQANTYYYDASWRLLEERIDQGHTPDSGWLAAAPAQPASVPTDSITQRVWGLEYIDELIYFHTDGPVTSGGAGESEGEGEGEPTITPADGDFANAKGYYALVDRLYSVIGVADASHGNLLERVRYTPYGVARRFDADQMAAKGDVDGDGFIGFSDLTAVNGAYGGTLANASSAYDPDCDFDRDGDVDGVDLNKVLSFYGQSYPTLAEGQISLQNIGNTVGYAGYIFDPATERNCVRFRWLDPSLGAWISRDPKPYLSMLSLYEYSASPLVDTDPMGEQALPPIPGRGNPPVQVPIQPPLPELFPYVPPVPSLSDIPCGPNQQTDRPDSNDRWKACRIWAQSQLAGRYGTARCHDKIVDKMTRCCAKQKGPVGSDDCAQSGLSQLGKCNHGESYSRHACAKQCFDMKFQQTCGELKSLCEGSIGQYWNCFWACESLGDPRAVLLCKRGCDVLTGTTCIWYGFCVSGLWTYCYSGC